MNYRFLPMVLALAASFALAAIDPHNLPEGELRQRYQNLIDELRCPKCQNENLAGSNSPIAADLRREIRRMLEEGKSDEEIVTFLVSRYGDFIRYRPAVQGNTLLLWFTPLALLLVGVGVVLVVVRRHRAMAAERDALDAEEEARLRTLLEEDNDR